MTEEEWTAVRLSLLVATTATAASLPLGIAVAWLLARGRFWGKSLVDTLVHLPLIMPPVVTGYLLLLTFGRRGTIGAFLADEFGIVFSFRWTGAALACAVMGFPLLVRAIRLSIEAVDPRLESAAGTLGANPLWVFATVTLPLSLPGVIAGAILCFAKAMGEFGATITFVSNIPGRDADPAVADLHADAGPRRRCRCDAPHPDIDRHLDAGVAGLGAAGPAVSAPGGSRHESRRRRRSRARALPAHGPLLVGAGPHGAVRPLGVGQDPPWSTSSAA